LAANISTSETVQRPELELICEGGWAAQKGEWNDENGHMWNYDLRRVAVRNSSKQTAHNVSVKVEHISPEPEGLRGYLPFPLQFQHRPGIADVSLPSGDMCPVDTISYMTRNERARFCFVSSTPKLAASFEPGSYEITVRARSGQGASDEKRFVIDVRNGTLTMNAV